MFPRRFPTDGAFKTKNGRKGNFVSRKVEFSLSNLHSLVSSGIQGAVISKMVGRTKIKLLQDMFASSIPTIVVFHAKKGWKGNFSME